ncbi:MAG TPA: methionyl-tRNA formyltransferase [Chromatiaceae bacterium]|jgi:methionyl-tRNA formyltransferase|nr:MAG: hypothetical protein N838_07210 [Thiohalocapsa sp. PB-PSB1]QQO52709.1 MAG: methionyl-tRNA formyltransferase [Thiohalocapsa sp. PB-PSB1]HBG96583.1 methionyl-tRNA formyltransferase [Chromatiaceae bacterium]HCS89501.1 methionyl-tRNA formyltransferase [Chromatiaceae bacterium]
MHTTKPRIIYAGTPEFAVPPLQALIAAEYNIVDIYTQPDRPAGRGRKLMPSPVKQMAMQAGITVRQPTSLNEPQELARMRALNADLMVVAAYGLLLPPAALDATRLGCINIHASLLPRWRGAAPIQRAILAGDTQTGICIMQMEAGLDTGPVYTSTALMIADDETGGSLHDRLALLGAEALISALPGILDGSLMPKPQNETLSTYATKLSKQEARIDWSNTAIEIERQVRAFNPWPVAETRLNGDLLRLWAARALEQTAPGRPGQVFATGRDGIDVVTGAGLLRITRLQAAGKRPISAFDFVNAHDLDGVLLG